MPYIPQEARTHLDEHITLLQNELLLAPRDCRKGRLNYVVTRIALGCFAKGRYHEVSDMISALRDAADEIARRLMGTLEDRAISGSGDLIEYES